MYIKAYKYKRCGIVQLNRLFVENVLKNRDLTRHEMRWVQL